MTDLEMTKLCAEAMGLVTETRKTFRNFEECLTQTKPGEWWDYYDPLNNDTQAMALAKRMDIDLFRVERDGKRKWECGRMDEPGHAWARNADMNRAIVECVAKMVVAQKQGKSPENAEAK